MAYYEGEISPMGTNCNNGGFGANGWGDLAALIVVAGLFGWGNGGFGVGGNRGGCGAPATQADLANGFAQNTLQRGIDDIILGQATMQNFINQGFNGINSTVTNGFANLNTALCGFNYNVQGSFNELSHQLSDCCCATQRAIDSVKLENERNACNIINASNANTRAILDYLTSEKIASLQAENSGLKAQISNDRQSMYITDTILDRLSPCPKPSYFVPNPNCCYNYGVTPFGNCGASVQ